MSLDELKYLEIWAQRNQSPKAGENNQFNAALVQKLLNSKKKDQR